MSRGPLGDHAPRRHGARAIAALDPASQENVPSTSDREPHEQVGNRVLAQAARGQAVGGLGPIVAQQMAFSAAGVPGVSPFGSNQAMLRAKNGGQPPVPPAVAARVDPTSAPPAPATGPGTPAARLQEEATALGADEFKRPVSTAPTKTPAAATAPGTEAAGPSSAGNAGRLGELEAQRAELEGQLEDIGEELEDIEVDVDESQQDVRQIQQDSADNQEAIQDRKKRLQKRAEVKKEQQPAKGAGPEQDAVVRAKERDNRRLEDLKEAEEGEQAELQEEALELEEEQAEL